jgi:hypothetical protein
MKLLPVGGTVNQIEQPAPSIKYGYQVLFAAGIDKGLNTSQDPADIQNGEVVVASGAINRFGKMKRADGSSPLDPTDSIGGNYKPDSNPVIAFHFHETNGVNPNLWRFTPTTVYRRDSSGVYTAVTGLALTGSVTDRMQIVSFLDTIVFANNGINELQKIDTSTLVASDLRASNVVSTKFKYITTFYNRIVGAYETTGPNPTSVYWSGDDNITVWDPLVDVSAGQSPILDNPDETSDFITGIFGLDDYMVVMRQRSLWVATKQPIASNPFYFRCVVPDKGCDCPHSIAVVNGGVAWADNRTKTIWAYLKNEQTPDYYYSDLIRIGLPIETTFWNNVADSTQIYGSYNARTMDYTLCVPATSSSIVNRWTYNFRTKVWTGPTQFDNSFTALTGMGDVELSNFSGTTFDELVGTFDDLAGTFDEMSGDLDSQLATTRVYGWANGECSVEDEQTGFDFLPGAPAPSPPIYPSFEPLQSIIVSKIFTFPTDDIIVAMVRIGIKANTNGIVNLATSKNGRAFVSQKTVNFVPGDQQIIQYKAAIKCRTLQFQLTLGGIGGWTFGQSNINDLEIINYEIHIYRSGESSQ